MDKGGAEIDLHCFFRYFLPNKRRFFNGFFFFWHCLRLKRLLYFNCSFANGNSVIYFEKTMSTLEDVQCAL